MGAISIPLASTCKCGYTKCYGMRKTRRAMSAEPPRTGRRLTSYTDYRKKGVCNYDQQWRCIILAFHTSGSGTKCAAGRSFSILGDARYRGGNRKTNRGGTAAYTGGME